MSRVQQGLPMLARVRICLTGTTRLNQCHAAMGTYLVLVPPAELRRHECPSTSVYISTGRCIIAKGKVNRLHGDNGGRKGHEITVVTKQQCAGSQLGRQHKQVSAIVLARRIHLAHVDRSASVSNFAHPNKTVRQNNSVGVVFTFCCLLVQSGVSLLHTAQLSASH